MFGRIEQHVGWAGPQWLSDHPNPGNRYAYITQEAQSLHVVNARHDSSGFQSVQAHLRGMPPAPSTEEATKNTRNGRNPNTRGGGETNGGGVPTHNRAEHAPV